MQVSAKDELEYEIMRENVEWFKLVYLLLLLEGELYKELSTLGEGKFLEDVL
jgi:hypothetical protein